MNFDKKKYIEDFKNYAYWNGKYKAFTETPHSSQIRDSIDEKVKVNAPGLNDHSLDSLLLGKLSDSRKPVFEKTKDNLNRILNDLTEDYSIDDAVDLITSLPYSKVGSHSELNDAHEKYLTGQAHVEKYQEAIQTGNEGLKDAVVGSMLSNILDVVDEGEGIKGAYVFIAKSQPEVLVSMYQNTILSVLKNKLTNKLSFADGEKLKKSTVTSYVHELVKDNDMALNFIANQAYELYSKK